MQAPPSIAAVMALLRELNELEPKRAKNPGKNPSDRQKTLLRRIDAVRAQLPGPILSHHDRIRARGKSSVAAVKHWVCCNCFLQVPSGSRANLITLDDLPICEHCGSYLYLDTPPEAQN
ncbi:MAG: hypothetical protein IT577_05345 [Verrucomicrobiae bacterium]|nr:hypothetical protein [Verrucomicrobiae bacterium]